MTLMEVDKTDVEEKMVVVIVVDKEVGSSRRG